MPRVEQGIIIKSKMVSILGCLYTEEIQRQNFIQKKG